MCVLYGPQEKKTATTSIRGFSDLCSGHEMCFLWGTNWIFVYYVEEIRSLIERKLGKPSSKLLPSSEWLQRDQSLLSSKRGPHFKMHKCLGKNKKYCHGSRRGPKPILTVLAKASIKLPLWSFFKGLIIIFEIPSPTQPTVKSQQWEASHCLRNTALEDDLSATTTLSNCIKQSSWNADNGSAGQENRSS
jgi:hypothetical protein